MRHYILLICVMASVLVHAQADRQFIREGNKLYRMKQYAQAEILYRKAVASNASNPQAVYNLGCALMMQQKDSAAVAQYEKAAKMETNKLRLAKAYHNIGVVCQNHQMYGEAIQAYQQALRNNPSDDETRYNLALCKKKNKQKNDDKKQNQDKQDKKEQQQDKKDQQQQKDKDKQQQQAPDQQMSKENAEQLLNAAIQNEKSTQQRMKKAMQQPKRRTSEKNW